MESIMRKGLTLAVALLAASWAGVSRADNVVQIGSRTGLTDTINWNQLGGILTSVADGTTVTSTDGVKAQVSEASGSGLILQQGTDWAGNFSNGDFLYYTGTAFGDGSGPITIDFDTPVSAVGMQVQEDYYGAFAGTLSATALNPAGGDLGTYTFSGNADGNGDGSAPFVGIADLSGANIASIVISLTSANGPTGDFAINEISLTGGATVPAPSGLLGGMVLLGLVAGGLGFRRLAGRVA
jgi:hypothetical protein